MLCPAGLCNLSIWTGNSTQILAAGAAARAQVGAAQAGLAVSCHLSQQRAFTLLCISLGSPCNLHFKASPVLPVSPVRRCAATGARGQGEGHSQPSQHKSLPGAAGFPKPDPRARHGGGSSCSRKVLGEGEGEIGFRGSKCSSPEWMYIFIIH